ncbi:MAG: hypothetical protein ACRD1X_05535 [Vicinamibacteria bacterium]
MRNRMDLLVMAGGATVFAAATAAMLQRWEPFATWYYSFAWWTYIVFADAWNHRRTERSVLLRNPEAPQMLALSITIWATFEAYNFRLGNWYYIEIPSDQVLRWIGYSVAYATVLPGILVTAEILSTVGAGRAGSGLALPRRLATYLFWGGLVGSVLPWIWPRYFFPLVWLGPTAFFMAVNFRSGGIEGRGLLTDISQRGLGKLYRLAASGMICGLLWECWNYWARSKWIYDIPFFGGSPLFEMPLAGFLGFPPFAVACHEMHETARTLLNRMRPYPVARFVVWLVLAVAVGWVYRGIDAFTVRSFQP